MQQPPYQQPSPPPKKSHRRTWIILGIICIVLFAASVATKGLPTSSTASTVTPTAQTAATDTPAPTNTPQPTDTPKPQATTQALVITHGSPHLRGPQSDFWGKYGTPLSINGSNDSWTLNQDYSLSVTARDTAGGTVGYLSITTPDGWNLQKIEDFCLSFAPQSYTVDPTSPPGVYNPIVFDSPDGKFAIHIQTAYCSMNTI
jgi:hypothetical protein